MKKILFLLTMFIFANAKSQDTCINDARIYTNTNITANGVRAITGAKLNTSLNKIIDAIDCVGGGVFIATDSNTVINYNVLNSQNAPPVSPIAGDTYLVGTVPTGAWVGHAKDIATWDGSAWTFIDGVQGDYLYNTTNLLTYIYRSGNWVQTGGIPALNNGNTISSGLRIGTNNLKSLTFETNNVPISRFDSIGNFYLYNTPLGNSNDTFVVVQNPTNGKLSKIGKSNFAGGGGVPLTGTEVGNPVTGDIEFYKTGEDISAFIKYNNVDALFMFGSNEQYVSGSALHYRVDGADNYIDINPDMVNISSMDTGFHGIGSAIDFTPNITDLDYTQKKYVDTRISDTAAQIRSEIPDVSNFATITNLADTSSVLRGLITSSIPTFTLSKNATRDSIVTTYNGTRSAVKDSSIVMPTFSFGRNASLDSIYAIYNGTRYSAKDSLPTTSATSTTTFTNKRITARVDSTTSSATPTINTDNVDTYKLTAQAADITSFTTNLSGTPTDDQILHIVIIGTAARAITWGAKFESSTVTLPTTTVSTNRLDVYFIWNTATSKWRCGGVW